MVKKVEMNQWFGAQNRGPLRTPKSNRCQGFTVIEVVIALLILAVTTAFATQIHIRSMVTQADALRATQAALHAREEVDRLVNEPDLTVGEQTLSPAVRAGIKLPGTVEVMENRVTIRIRWSRPEGENPSVELVSLRAPRSARSQ